MTNEFDFRSRIEIPQVLWRDDQGKQTLLNSLPVIPIDDTYSFDIARGVILDRKGWEFGKTLKGNTGAVFTLILNNPRGVPVGFLESQIYGQADSDSRVNMQVTLSRIRQVLEHVPLQGRLENNQSGSGSIYRWIKNA